MSSAAEKDRIFLFSGEVSGDMHGGRLVKALKKQLPSFSFEGVGGVEMRAQELNCLWDSEEFGVMGFSDVLYTLPTLWKRFRQIKEYILDSSPRAVVFIDSPGFSLRMAKTLRKNKFVGKLIQYVCPSVWAWGRSRVEQLAKDFDLLLPIYPFEAACFSHTNLRVEYVGNPIQEAIEEHQYDVHWNRLFGIKNQEQLIGLFPGSRVKEIRRNLPVLLETAKIIQQQYPKTTFAISCSNEKNLDLLQELLDQSSLRRNREVFVIPKTYSYELMRSCRSALAKSGTVTLELALHRCPTVVMYELSWLNQWIAKYLLGINLPHYCIVNILDNSSIFPEIIKHRISPTELSEQLFSIHTEGPRRNLCIAGCNRMTTLLTKQNISDRAAAAIRNVIL